MSQRKYNIGVLTPPIEIGGITPLSNLMGILEIISNDLYLITGGAGYDYFKNSDRITTYENNLSSHTTTLKRIGNFIFFQINESRKIFEVSKNVDFWFFFFSAESQLFPMIMAMLCRKKVIIIITGSSIKTLETEHDFLRFGLMILKYITCSFAKNIILYSNKLIKELNFEKWDKKILIAHRHFVNFDTFKITTPLSTRLPLIGYIGRLSEEKGIQNLVKALPDILNDRKDLHFILGGDGPLIDSIENSLKVNNLATRVDNLGWINREDLPKYLNQLQLLVLPSYTEGLPNIILEAMACGTPVLATPVGAIPDIIRDGETGFIMENNSPWSISANVMRALSSLELERIAGNGRQLVMETYTFEKAVDSWSKILDKI